MQTKENRIMRTKKMAASIIAIMMVAAIFVTMPMITAWSSNTVKVTATDST